MFDSLTTLKIQLFKLAHLSRLFFRTFIDPMCVYRQISVFVIYLTLLALTNPFTGSCYHAAGKETFPLNENFKNLTFGYSCLLAGSHLIKYPQYHSNCQHLGDHLRDICRHLWLRPLPFLCVPHFPFLSLSLCLSPSLPCSYPATSLNSHNSSMISEELAALMGDSRKVKNYLNHFFRKML